MPLIPIVLTRSFLFLLACAIVFAEKQRGRYIPLGNEVSKVIYSTNSNFALPE
ncbi:hypothetical protein PVAP13_7NG198951 [Panicum virgatum]|uniref:Uncharacterized protein n=1 Tax=Panicum virgatum TaxID=38727 RepID=A0A8T0PXB4_PANVG|nr:hypothetical protein PVAP13_7NG198951 [Panicum virgatum]